MIFMITHVYDPNLFRSYNWLIKAKNEFQKSLSAIAKLHNWLLTKLGAKRMFLDSLPPTSSNAMYSENMVGWFGTSTELWITDRFHKRGEKVEYFKESFFPPLLLSNNFKFNEYLAYLSRG